VIGTLRRDCLDHIIVWGERHAEQVLKEYVGYYHGRPHRGLHMQSPDGGQHPTVANIYRRCGLVRVRRSSPDRSWPVYTIATDSPRDLHQPGGWRRDGVFPAHTHPDARTASPALTQSTEDPPVTNRESQE
jgi:hypothetical protein